MKTSLLALVLVFYVAIAVEAQDAPAEQTGTQSSSANRSTEADETGRLNRSVISLYNQRKFDEALPLAQRALTLREQSAERDDILIASALSNLAAVYFAKEDYAAAKPLLERAVKLYEARADAEPLMHGETLESLGSISIRGQDYFKAESLFKRAIALKEKKLGFAHPKLGSPLLQLGVLAQFRGSNKDARNFYGRALDVYDNLPRPVSESIANTLEGYICKMMEVSEPKDRAAVSARVNRIIADPPPPDIEPTAALPQPRRLRGGVLNGKATFRAAPEYPAEAKRNRMQGIVLVAVTIDPTGKVIDARVRCGYTALRKSSVGAAKRWKFTPTILSGNPVEVTGTIVFNFELR
jgi:TonB family protein